MTPPELNRRTRSFLGLRQGRASPPRPLLPLALTFAGLVTAACSPGGPGLGAEGESGLGNGDPAAAGKLTLTVVAARQARSAAGYDRLEVRVRLANPVGGAPISLDPARFSVKTTDGVLRTGTTGPSFWVDGSPCAAATALDGDAATECLLLFDTNFKLPSELRYQAPLNAGDKRTANVAFAVEPCSSCGNLTCTYFDRDPANCGSCGTTLGHEGTCSGGKLTCHDAGKAACLNNGLAVCTDLQFDARNCGSCGNAASGCENGKPWCPPGNTSYSSVTGWKCADFQRDPRNCGAAGRSCTLAASSGGAEFCSAGKCGVAVSYPLTTNVELVDCKGMCSGLGLTCRSIVISVYEHTTGHSCEYMTTLSSFDSARATCECTE
ncbi:MAG: repeat domain protein [Myxococcaceae bacterium]|nr:repeat domain protein [Myxococcaceae bacterium]